MLMAIGPLCAGLLVAPGIAADASVGMAQMTLDALVTTVLAHNPELKFYQSEIAAARGAQHSAGAWGNPDLSAALGEKRVAGGPLTDEGIAWSVSVRQTF